MNNGYVKSDDKLVPPARRRLFTMRADDEMLDTWHQAAFLAGVSLSEFVRAVVNAEPTVKALADRKARHRWFLDAAGPEGFAAVAAAAHARRERRRREAS